MPIKGPGSDRDEAVVFSNICGQRSPHQVARVQEECNMD